MLKTYLISLPLLLAIGCSAPATTVIGTACKKTGDCNVPGQVCAGGICTHSCTGVFNQCPIGYTCTDSGNMMLTCNQAPYSVDPMTGLPVLFGVDCASNAAVCGSTGDPNPAPTCRHGEDPSNHGMALKADPLAFCTGGCSVDADCPFNFLCTTDYDMVKKCLRRDQCSPCVYNDNCPPGFACVPPDPKRAGAVSYCAKSCNTQTECPGANQKISYTVCTATTDANMMVGKFCLHRYGACVGTGEICDPCRTKADCALSGTNCITNPGTGEHMCTKPCANDAVCAGPNNASCDNTDPMNSIGVCTGDPAPAHSNPGLFTCWLQ